MQILIKKDTPWWSQITGLGETVYDRCQFETKLVLRNLARAMVLTALLSAASITTIVHFFYHPEEPAMAILVALASFFGWFGIILSFDKSLMVANRYGIVAFFRFIATIFLAFLHTFIGMELTYSADIKQVLLEQKHGKMSKDAEIVTLKVEKLKQANLIWHAKIDEAKKLIDKQEAGYQYTIQHLDNFIALDRPAISESAGKAIKLEAQRFRDDTFRFNGNIRQNQSEIDALNVAFTKLDESRDVSELGFVNYLSAIELMIFDGTYGLKFWLALAMFIVAFIIEALALFYKSTAALFEYYEIERKYLVANLEFQDREIKKIFQEEPSVTKSNGLPKTPAAEKPFRDLKEDDFFQ
jgi:hypothetical protein